MAEDRRGDLTISFAPRSQLLEDDVDTAFANQTPVAKLGMHKARLYHVYRTHPTNFAVPFVRDRDTWDVIAHVVIRRHNLLIPLGWVFWFPLSPCDPCSSCRNICLVRV